VRPAPLPPLAPGAPAPVPATVAPNSKRLSRLQRVALFLVAVSAALLLIYLLPSLIFGGSPEDGTTGNDAGAPPAGSTSPGAPPPPATVYLSALKPVAGGWEIGAVTIDGRDYANSMSQFVLCGEYEMAYALSGRYTKLRGLAGLLDDSEGVSPTPFKILLDGKVALSGVIQLRRQVPIDLNVSGAIRLSIVAVGPCRGTQSATVGLGDPVLERLP